MYKTYIALETKLLFQQAILCFAVLTCIRAIDSVIRAHYRSNPGFHGILEWPKIQFVHGSVVEIGGNGFDGLAVGADRRIPLGFLLVADVIYACVSLYSSFSTDLLVTHAWHRPGVLFLESLQSSD